MCTNVDEDLQAIIDVYQQNANTANDPSSYIEVRELALYNTIVLVGQELLGGNVLLLPTVYDKFVEMIHFYSQLLQTDTQYTAVSTTWLLSNLSSALEHHLVSSCKIRKYGTMLHRPNTDFAAVLQKALYQIRQNEQVEALKPKKFSNTSVTPAVTEQVLDSIHTGILDQCQALLGRKDLFYDNYTKLDIEHEISQINRVVWNAVCKPS